MPAQSETRYSREWFRVADEDLRRVVRCLRAQDTEDAAFHLQQALEKCLKGYLLSRRWELKRIHDLELLLDDAVARNAALERFRALCQQVTGFYMVDRYPTLEEGPSDDEVRKAHAQAKTFVRCLQMPQSTRGRRTAR